MTTKEKLSRRDFLRAASMVSAGAVLAACGAQTPASQPAGQSSSQATSAPPPTTKASAEPVTIRYRYLHPESNNLGKYQKAHLEKYNFMVPDSNVKVDLELGVQADRTMADLAAGTAPDVFWSDYATAGMDKAIQEDLFVCAEDYMKAAGFNFGDFVDGLERIYKPAVFGGKMWGIPYEQVVVLWATNLEVFEAAGVEPKKDWTWDDAIEMGLKLTKDKAGKHPNESGFNVNEVDVWALQPWQFFAIQEYLPYTAGGAYWDANTRKATINTQAFVDTLQWLRDIYQKHNIATMSPPEKGLFTGKVAMQETGNWALVDFSKNMNKVGCVYTPVHPTAKKNATPWFDKELWLVKQKDESRVQAAYTFASWWAFKEYLDYAIDTGYFPFLKSHMQDPKWQSLVKDKPYMQTAMEMPAFSTPRFWSLFEGATEAQAPLKEMWDAAVKTDTPIEQLVEKANAEVQRVITKYNS